MNKSNNAVVVSTSEMEQFEKNTEGTRGIKTLCELANILGYLDPMQSGYHSNGKGDYTEGDLIEMLKDNPFLVEALVEQIKDNLLEVKEFYDEEDSLPDEIVSKIKRYCKLHKSEYLGAGEEVDATRLAEDIANEYNIFTDVDSEIHPEVFEIVSNACENDDEEELDEDE